MPGNARRWPSPRRSGQGKCHRKHTARLRTGKVERVRQERTARPATGRHGKPHRVQDRIGAAYGLVPARRPGWLLEAKGNLRPRGMVASLRCKRGDAQNPAYRSPGTFFICARLANWPARTARLDLKWPERRDPTTGAFPAGAPMAPRAAPRRACGCATGRAATQPGDRPAPKAPNSQERWYFCEAHAAEYNKNWNYFAGLDRRGSGQRAAEEEARRVGLPPVCALPMGGPGDGSRSRDEMRALDVLELDGDADFKAVEGRLSPAGQGTSSGPEAGRQGRGASASSEIQAAYDVLAQGRRAARRRAQV